MKWIKGKNCAEGVAEKAELRLEKESVATAKGKRKELRGRGRGESMEVERGRGKGVTEKKHLTFLETVKQGFREPGIMQIHEHF